MRPHVFSTMVLIALPLAGSAYAGVVVDESTPPALNDSIPDPRSPIPDQAQPRETMRFRGMDRNRDGVITRSEWRGSEQSFRVHDWNGDGILSGNEVRVGATREIDEEDDLEQMRRREFDNWTAEGFTSLDHNRDGRISRSEWHYGWEAFNRADRNRDSMLSRSEFLGNDTDLDREDRFDYLDANRNGRIERSEWHGSNDAFEWLDRNNDGRLSRAEVAGETAAESDLFASLDNNRDNSISFDEWHWSRRAFDRQDQNGDGVLTRSELTNAEIASGTGAIATSGQTITVSARERWVDTGLDVRVGDVISIQAEGTIAMSEGTADIASPAGSRAGRRAPAAPLPDQAAGALIARIGDSTPILVGASQVINARSNGRLFLTVNDDHLLDNRGQFRVTIQRR